jgi:glutathione synthase/RimK-type ligase-like ATP-grasp enzyme
VVLLYAKSRAATPALIESYSGWRVATRSTPPSVLEHSGVVIRYGFAAPIGSNRFKVINKAEAIQLAGNKLAALSKMRREGVTVPDHWSLEDQLPEFPCVARTATHFAGNGLWLCLQESDVREALRGGADYAIKYIPTTKEFRVHVIGDAAVISQRKKRASEPPEEGEEIDDTPGSASRPELAGLHRWVRNNATGWNLVRRTLREGISEIAVKSVAALGLDFGAVDILIADNAQPYVIEVNTAPGLGVENTVIWCNAMKLYMERKLGVQIQLGAQIQAPGG